MPAKTLHATYMGLISDGQIERDPNQLMLIKKLDLLLQSVSHGENAESPGFFERLFGKKSAAQAIGLYVWGDVGRGKSMIMDMFFDALPNQNKRRAHFNDFMQDAQERIHAHREAFKRGEVSAEDPIPVIGEQLAHEAQVLCFDEFTVTDIADAMILGRLFEAMFDAGVVIVATSNVEPKNLYKNGLNRNLFLPFIDLLEKHVDVVMLDAPKDYRLEKLDQAPVYLTPINASAKKTIDETWLRLSGVERGNPVDLPLKGRVFTVPQAASGVARLSFHDLCREARSAADYLALAYRFHTVFIDEIPVMNREDQNAAKRFILLIDTLYDNHIRIVVTAQSQPEGLYTAKSGTEAFEFKRTISRLHEMQSVTYIGKQ